MFCKTSKGSYSIFLWFLYQNFQWLQVPPWNYSSFNSTWQRQRNWGLWSGFSTLRKVCAFRTWLCRAAFVFYLKNQISTDVMSGKQFSLPGLKAQSSKLVRHSGERLWAEMWKQIADICCPEAGVNGCSVGQSEGNGGYRSPQLTPALGEKIPARSRDSLSLK